MSEIIIPPELWPSTELAAMTAGRRKVFDKAAEESHHAADAHQLIADRLQLIRNYQQDAEGRGDWREFVDATIMLSNVFAEAAEGVAVVVEVPRLKLSTPTNPFDAALVDLMRFLDDTDAAITDAINAKERELAERSRAASIENAREAVEVARAHGIPVAPEIKRRAAGGGL